MKRVLSVPLIAILVALLAGCVQAPTTVIDLDAKAASSTVEVKIIAFNDFHGNLRTPSLRVPVPDASQSIGIRFDPAGGIEQFSALVQSLKAKNRNVAVVSAGDMVGATPLLSALFNDEPTIEAMNLVGVDFHAVGNHEFDYGIKHLKRLKEGGCKVDEKTLKPDCGGRTAYAGAQFAFLAANVIEEATGKPLFPAWGVKEFDGIKVAFIGMTLRGTADIVRPGGSEGVSFRDEVETVNALVPQIRAQGIEAIVVLIHEGGIQSGGINDCTDFKGEFKSMVERFDSAVDVVVSAHTHRYYICNFGGKLTTSAGSFGTMVTEIDLKLDRATRNIVGKTAHNLVVRPDGPKDERLSAHIESYAKLSKPRENRVVAKVTQELPIFANAAGESLLGNLIADAQMAASNITRARGAELRLSEAHFATNTPQSIAFNNPRSVRAPLIPAADGSVTFGELFQTQPFQNDMIGMTLTGAQIKEALEQQFSGDRPRIMGVSRNFTYTWDESRAKGDKVLADSIKLNGVTVKPEERYRIVANSFLAGGSDGFIAFLKGVDRSVGLLDVEVLVNYLAAESPYTPPPIGRLKRLN